MSILVNDVSPRVHYLATNGQTVFVVPFAWIHNSDLKVYVNQVLATFDAPPDDEMKYSTTGEGLTAGGSITFGPPGRSPGDEVIIYRDMPIARTTDMPTSGVFSVEALNRNFDDITVMVQQTEVNVQMRTLREADDDFVHPLLPIPYKYERAGKLLGFDVDGQPTVYAIGAGGGGGGGGGGGSLDGGRHWTGDGPPPTPWTDGDWWWESDTGNSYVYYDDGDSKQWVQTNITTATPQQSVFVTRAEMKALDPAVNKNAFLIDYNRAGQFRWVAGNYSAAASLDPGEGVYITSSVTPNTLGIWSRQVDWKSEGVSAGWFGVMADGSSDDTGTLQAAVNFSGATGVVLRLSSGTHVLTSTITVGQNARVVGTGSLGTWLSGWGSGTVGKGTIFFINHTGIGFDVRSAYAGASMKGFTTYRTQPTPGPGWVPTAHDFDIRIYGSVDVTVEDVNFINATKAILVSGSAAAGASGQIYLKKIKGQPMTVGIEMHYCYNLCYLDEILFWPVWSNDGVAGGPPYSSVRAWQRANCTTLHAYRVDGLKIGKIFSIGHRYGILFSVDAADGPSLPAGDASGVWVGDAYFDSVCTAVQCDAGTAGVIAHFDKLHAHGGQGWSVNNYLVRDTGTSNRLTIDELHLAMNDNPFVYMDGNDGSIVAQRVLVDRWDQDATGASAFAVVAPNRLILGPIDYSFTTPAGLALFSGTGIIESEEWRIFHPTVTASTGVFTSVTEDCRYRRSAGMIDFEFTISIVTNGTAAGTIFITMPVAALVATPAYGVQTNSSLHMVKGIVNIFGTPRLDVTKYDASYAGGTGVSFRISGSYAPNP